MGKPPANNENPAPQDASKSRQVKKESTNKDNTKDTRKIAMIVALVVILLGLTIGLSVGLTQRNKRSDQSTDNNPPSDFSTLGEGTGVGSLSAPTMYSAPVTDLNDGLLPWRIQSFGTNVIEGYGGCDDLRAYLAEAGAYLANVVIRRNSRYGPSYGGGYVLEEGVDDVAEESGMVADMDLGAPMASEMESAKETAREPEFAADEADHSDQAANDGGSDASEAVKRITAPTTRWRAWTRPTWSRAMGPSSLPPMATR